MKTNARVLEAGTERLGDGRGGLGAPLAVGVLQEREALLERGRLVAAGERHLERGGLLGEEALERRAASDVRLGEHALLGLRELVRAVAAQRAQVVGGECELRGLEQLVGTLVRHEVPLEVEEEQLRLDRRAELARLLEQRAARGVGRVERVAQHRVRTRAPAEVVDLGQLVHRLGQLGHVQLGDTAAVALGERLGALARLGQHRLDRLGPPPSTSGSRFQEAASSCSSTVALTGPRLASAAAMAVSRFDA